jgi:hypothetical protein
MPEVGRMSGGDMLSVVLPWRDQPDHIGEVLQRFLAP